VSDAVLNKQSEDFLRQALPVFARHETFHPRFGWLKKGYDRTKQDPAIFLQQDAPVTLGVGKNMVNAIRYWTQAFKLIEEAGESESKGTEYLPSDFGLNLLDDNGWDPYLENLGSLWLLHWYLVKPVSIAATWYFAFNAFSHIEFNSDEFLKELSDFRTLYFPRANAVEASLKKDANCFLRMYAEGASNKKGVREESIDSPFIQLGLMQSHRSHHYQFNIGYKPTLPPEIIVFACLDFAAMYSTGQTLKLDSLLFKPGSPGFVFRLNEASLCEAIEKVARKFKQVQYSEAAGLLQLSFQGDPKTLGHKLLNRYYKEQA